MSDAHGSNPSNSVIPTAAQLAETRQRQWHQQGEALLTLENLRSWINAAGLVLFVPRPQIVAPAPSLVEAVLGEANATPTLEQITEARGLLARLVAEGLAVPLNLMGASGPGIAGGIGETPDFVCSTAVFSYVFTLRGDKAWKQPPATSGPLKVSQLALAIHEALTKSGPLTASHLANEVGKEVTEAAVLRALGELWTHLRVLPLTMPDGQPTMWELAGARFTKQIKAGANAGQPSALSALISLYLGQAVVASEDEIESFLSPLAARSRIRDVVHALMAGRQLDTLAVEGRTVLHVFGELPAFLAPAVAVAEGDDTATSVTTTDSEDAIEVEASGAAGETEPDGEADGRIKKYVPKPRKIGTGYLAKASPSKFAGAKPAGAGFAKKPGGTGFPAKSGFKAGAKGGFKSGPKAGFKPRGGFDGPKPDRERRPFKSAEGGRAGGFDKPWEEEKAKRLAAAARPSDTADAAGDAGPVEQAPPQAPRKSFSKPGTFGRKREGFAGKRESFGGKREGFAGKTGDARGPRREFKPREERGGRPAFGERPARTGYPGKPQSDRPARGEAGGFAARKPYPPRGAGFFSGKPRPSDNRTDQPGRPDHSTGAPRDRQERGVVTESGKRVYPKFDARKPGGKKFDGPKTGFGGPRPRFDGGRSGGAGESTSSSERPARAGGFAGRPKGDYAPRRTADKPGGAGPASRGRIGGFEGKKPFGKSGGFGEKRSFGAAGGGRSEGAKKPYSKAGGSFAGKPGSTFAKFAGGKKPFGKRPPARKFKAKEEGAE